VGGEVSNFTRAVSGHWYFSLKDSQAQVRCVMFRHRSGMLDFVPENGMQIEVLALATLYEARGEFQLGVETMRRAGLGAPKRLSVNARNGRRVVPVGGCRGSLRTTEIDGEEYDCQQGKHRPEQPARLRMRVP